MRATDFEFDPNVERPEPSHDKIVMYSAFPEHNLFLNAVRLLWCMLFFANDMGSSASLFTVSKRWRLTVARLVRNVRRR